MNTDILKYKAKAVNTGEWVESITISLGTIKRKMNNLFFEVSEDKWVVVYKETLCRSTGLKDKNGKLIFEGDKLFYAEDAEDEYLVNKKPQVSVTWSEENLEWDTKPIIGQFGGSLWEWKDSEVVGNIHEK